MFKLNLLIAVFVFSSQISKAAADTQNKLTADPAAQKEAIRAYESQFGKFRSDGSSIQLPPGACATALGSKHSDFQKSLTLYREWDVLEAKAQHFGEDEGSDSLNKGRGNLNESQARLLRKYNEMLKMGGTRYLISPPTIEALQLLKELAPNHSEVVDYIRGQAAFLKMADAPMKTKPILLLGKPGVGKTHFAHNYAKIIGTSYELISFSNLSSGWVLSGNSAQWSGAREGQLAEHLVNNSYANPVIALDEIDKAASHSQYDPLAPLYGLLEGDTASYFEDEFLQVKMNASHVLWIATANYDDQIPEPILSRMKVFVIEPPDEAACRVIASALYNKYLKAYPSAEFSPELSEEVYAKLLKIGPRAMDQAIENAIGLAALDGRRHLIAKDIVIPTNFAPRSIGFTQ